MMKHLPRITPLELLFGERNHHVFNGYYMPNIYYILYMCYHLISKTILIGGWYGHYFKVKGTFRVAKKISQVIYMCGSRVHI